MAGKTGNQKVIEQFIADGFTYMFGNPGTVEQGFLDALMDYPELKYVLAYQESIMQREYGELTARAGQITI